MALKNGKLVQILKSFSPDEYKVYKKYMKNRLKEGSILYQFFLFLDQERADFEFSDEAIFNKIFKGASFNIHKLNDLANKLKTEIESFITYQAVEKTPYIKRLSMLEFYYDKQLNSDFYSEIKKIEASLEKPTRSSVEDSYVKLQVQKKIHQMKSTRESAQDKSLNLLPYSEALDAYYLHHKLRLMNMIYHQHRSYPDQEDIKVLPKEEEIIDGLFSIRPGKAVHEIWYLVYQMESAEEKKAKLKKYEVLKQKLKEILAGLNAKYALDIYDFNNVIICMQNIMIRFRGTKDLGFSKEITALHTMFIQRCKIHGNLTEVSGFFTQRIQFNFINNALNAEKNSKQAREFFNLFKSWQLFEEGEEGLKLMNLLESLILFKEEEYERALALIKDIKLNDPVFSISKSKLEVKIAYQYDDFEAFEKKIGAARTLLSKYQKKNKVGENIIAQQKVFLRIVVKMYKYKYKVDPDSNKAYAQLKEEIEDLMAVHRIDDPWLLSELARLK